MSKLLGVFGLIFLLFGLLASAVLVNDPFYLGPIHLIVGMALVVGWALGRARGDTRDAGRGPRRDALQPSVYKGVVAVTLGCVAIAGAARFLPFYADFTEQGIHSLHPSFVKALDSLTVPVEVRVFALQGQIPAGLRQTLEQAARRTERFSWVAVDPEREPAQIERFGIKQLPTIIVRQQSEPEKAGARVSGGVDETQLVRMVQSAARTTRPAIYFVTGHGERDLEDTHERGLSFFKELLEGQNLLVKPLVLLGLAAIPQDASLIVLAAPQREFVEREERLIDEYLDRGGSALYFYEPGSGAEIERVGRRYGVLPLSGVLAQRHARPFAAAVSELQVIVPPDAGHGHELARGIKGGLLLPTSGAFRIEEGAPVSVALSSPPQTWLETNPPAVSYEPGEQAGEFPLVVVSDGVGGTQGTSSGVVQKKGRVVFFSDVDIVTNLYLPKLGARDIALNSVRWLHGESVDWTIEPRGFRKAEFKLSPQTIELVYILGGLIVPESILILGLTVVYLRNRNVGGRSLDALRA